MRIGRPFQTEPSPATPTQRSRRIDWSIIPSTGRPSMRERDQRAEQRPAGDERLGAVDRIEHPDELGVDPVVAMLLAEDAVVGMGGGDQLAHRRLGLAIGDGDRAVVRLGLDRHRAAEIATLNLAGTVGEPMRQRLELPVPGAGHRGGRRQPPGSGGGSSASERR